MNKLPAKKIWISTIRAAELMGCCRDTVVNRLEEGVINGHRPSKTGWWRVDYESLCAYLLHIESGGSIEEWMDLRRAEKEPEALV